MIKIAISYGETLLELNPKIQRKEQELDSQIKVLVKINQEYESLHNQLQIEQSNNANGIVERQIMDEMLQQAEIRLVRELFTAPGKIPGVIGCSSKTALKWKILITGIVESPYRSLRRARLVERSIRSTRETFRIRSRR